MAERIGPKRGRPSRPVMLLLAALATAAIVAAAILLAHSGSSTTRNSTSKSSVPATSGTTVQAASLATLRALPGVLGHPVYWAGPRVGATYELTRSPDGRVYIRYLTDGAKVGSPLPDFLTVGTYLVPNAAAAVRAAAGQPGAVAVHVPGGVGFYNRTRPTSVYFAFPGSNVQVETYDPSSAVARRLVETGAITPVR